MSNNTNNEQKRDKIVHIAFTEDEKEDINRYRTGITASEFIREAVREKIIRITNPNHTNNTPIALNSELLLKISENTQKLITIADMEEKRKVSLKHVEDFSELIQKELKDLREKGEMSELKQETNKILKLLGAKSLSPQEIAEVTKIPLKTVSFIVTNKEYFRLNVTTGRFMKR